MTQRKVMVRKNFYLTVEQNSFLKKKKSLTVSEHIRRAIDEYIERMTGKEPATSPSEKGGKNG